MNKFFILISFISLFSGTSTSLEQSDVIYDIDGIRFKYNSEFKQEFSDDSSKPGVFLSLLSGNTATNQYLDLEISSQIRGPFDPDQFYDLVKRAFGDYVNNAQETKKEGTNALGTRYTHYEQVSEFDDEIAGVYLLFNELPGWVVKIKYQGSKKKIREIGWLKDIVNSMEIKRAYSTQKLSALANSTAPEMVLDSIGSAGIKLMLPAGNWEVSKQAVGRPSDLNLVYKGHAIKDSVSLYSISVIYSDRGSSVDGDAFLKSYLELRKEVLQYDSTKIRFTSAYPNVNGYYVSEARITLDIGDLEEVEFRVAAIFDSFESKVLLLEGMGNMFDFAKQEETFTKVLESVAFPQIKKEVGEHWFIVPNGFVVNKESVSEIEFVNMHEQLRRMGTMRIGIQIGEDKIGENIYMTMKSQLEAQGFKNIVESEFPKVFSTDNLRDLQRLTAEAPDGSIKLDVLVSAYLKKYIMFAYMSEPKSYDEGLLKKFYSNMIFKY